MEDGLFPYHGRHATRGDDFALLALIALHGMDEAITQVSAGPCHCIC